MGQIFILKYQTQLLYQFQLNLYSAVRLEEIWWNLPDKKSLKIKDLGIKDHKYIFQ